MISKCMFLIFLKILVVHHFPNIFIQLGKKCIAVYVCMNPCEIKNIS